MGKTILYDEEQDAIIQFDGMIESAKLFYDALESLFKQMEDLRFATDMILMNPRDSKHLRIMIHNRNTIRRMKSVKQKRRCKDR